jgi:hypothetical protein
MEIYDFMFSSIYKSFSYKEINHITVQYLSMLLEPVNNYNTILDGYY